MPEDGLDPLDASIEQATEVLLKFSIPLYQTDREGRPSLNGTGFFVKAGGKTFLVSAAHVMDTAKKHGLFFYATPGKVRHLSGRLLRSRGEEDRENDLIDIGILELSNESVPPYPEVEKFAMDISYLRPRFRPRTAKHYIFIGFPATKSEVSNQRREVTVTAYAFRNEPIDEGSYAAHGLNPDTHIALKLDLNRGFGPGGIKRHFPKPQGMSGSPIIVLFDENDESQSRVFSVVGVATTYRKASRLVFGTDVGYVIDAIEHAA